MVKHRRPALLSQMIFNEEEAIRMSHVQQMVRMCVNYLRETFRSNRWDLKQPPSRRSLSTSEPSPSLQATLGQIIFSDLSTIIQTKFEVHLITAQRFANYS